MTINGEEIETTPWHLFYTSDGWVEAGELEEGDSIVSLSGIDGSVESVIIINATQIMYDLTVEEVHTFAVGEGDWVVHNECGVSQEQIEEVIDSYPIDNGKGECAVCASDLYTLFNNAGNDVQIGHIMSRAQYLVTNNNITVSFAHGAGSPAFHEFVIVNGDMVFDQLTGAGGMTYSDYMETFWSADLGFLTTIIIRDTLER